jgi:hypothetical protein
MQRSSAGLIMFFLIFNALTSLANAGQQYAATPQPASASSGGTTVMELSHTGSFTTQQFTVASDWAVSYSYDCSKISGDDAGFVLSVQGGDYMVPTSKQGIKGEDTYYGHDAGTYYLVITSDCAWHLRVDEER